MRSKWVLYFMIFSSILLTLFVGYWLRESFQKARIDLHERSDFVFNQAVRNAEDSLLRWRFKLKDTVEINGDSTERIIIRIDSLHYRKDLDVPPEPHAMFLKSGAGVKDSIIVKTFPMPPQGPPKDLFSTATIIIRAAGKDNGEVDTMMVRLIESHFKQDAHQSLPKVTYEFRHFASPPQHNDPWMTRPYFDPVSGNRLAVILTPTLWTIWHQIWPQSLFSFILLFCIYGAFILSWRTLKRQEALTEMKDNFVSNMTHELKTPIATVSVALEALESFHVMENPEKTAEYLDMSKRELSRLHLLVDQVLKTTTMEGAKPDMLLESVNLTKLTGDILETLKLQTDRLHAKITIEADRAYPVEADRIHLTNVIYNLIDNGLKYSPVNPAIDIKITEIDGEVLWSITDQGLGIKTEDQSHIFEKFYRVSKGNTHNVKGYGLGLYYVKQVMDMLHGSILVQSKPGEGSCFELHFPKPSNS